jgi:hypothetical protein
MNPQSRGQEQAIAILAIATAVIGFGLFGGDFFGKEVSTVSQSGLPADAITSLRTAKAICGVMVVGQYVFVFISVKRVFLLGNDATGQHVVDGPLTQLFLQVWFLAIVFIIDVIETMATN